MIQLLTAMHGPLDTYGAIELVRHDPEIPPRAKAWLVQQLITRYVMRIGQSELAELLDRQYPDIAASCR